MIIVAVAADENVLSYIVLAVAGTPHGEPFIVVYNVVAAPVKMPIRFSAGFH